MRGTKILKFGTVLVIIGAVLALIQLGYLVITNSIIFNWIVLLWLIGPMLAIAFNGYLFLDKPKNKFGAVITAFIAFNFLSLIGALFIAFGTYYDPQKVIAEYKKREENKLENMSRTELMDEAAKLNIDGYSKMTYKQLIYEIEQKRGKKNEK